MNNDDGRLSERLEALLAIAAPLGLLDHEIQALSEAADLARRWEWAVVGTVAWVGYDEEGNPRVLVHSTIDELHRGAPLPYRRVRIVPDMGEGK